MSKQSRRRRLTKDQIIRAWVDPAFRASLTPDQREQLPSHPSGLSGEEALEKVRGWGQDTFEEGCPTVTFLFGCCTGTCANSDCATVCTCTCNTLPCCAYSCEGGGCLCA